MNSVNRTRAGMYVINNDDELLDIHIDGDVRIIEADTLLQLAVSNGSTKRPNRVDMD